MSKSILWILVFSFFGVNSTSAQKQELTVTLDKKNQALKSQDISLLSSLFHEKAKIYTFPKEEVAKGTASINDYFETQFSADSILNIKLEDRILFKGFIIDKEKVTTSKGSRERIVFYKFKKNKIRSMTILLSNSKTTPTARKIVDEQLAAYNAGDIKAFVNTYAEAVDIYDFPNRSRSSGRGALKQDYSTLFKNNSTLHCQIKQRMAMGHWIIDLESVANNSSTLKVVAIYEVENGLIQTVTFIQ